MKKITLALAMASQKGNITEVELEVVAQWMIDNLSLSDKKYDAKGKHH